MTEGMRKNKSRGWWAVIGGTLSILALGWILWRVDLERLRQVVVEAEIGYALLVPLALAVEQLVRGWKWRQLLHGIKSVHTLRLFGAIMAGYFANFLIPLGISPIVRSWLVARLEGLLRDRQALCWGKGL